ncbi:MAG: DUF4124 domain-containing protein [Burkholderiales bacterium]
MRFLLGVSLLFVFSGHVSADVYRWVDKDGKVQYSDRPPLSGEAKKLKKTTKDAGNGAPVTGGAAKPGASAADLELEFRKRKMEKEDAEKKTQAEKDNAEKNKGYCNNLRGELQAHKNGVRIVQYSDRGERLALGDNERAQSQARLEQRIAKECQ